MKNEILKHIATVRCGQVRPVMPAGVQSIDYDTLKPLYRTADGYDSELRLRVRFFCENDDSELFNLARENAASQMLDMLYGPCERKLRDLRASLYAGDRVECMKIIDELERYMTKVE